MMIVFNKPFGVLSQFTDSETPKRPTLADFGLPPDVYPAGRLDHDSEGLLLLSDDGARIAQISSPKFKWPKTYLIQVEGTASEAGASGAGQETWGGRTRRVLMTGGKVTAEGEERLETMVRTSSGSQIGLTRKRAPAARAAATPLRTAPSSVANVITM